MCNGYVKVNHNLIVIFIFVSETVSTLTMYSTFILYMRSLDTFQLYIEAILADDPGSLVFVSVSPLK